MESLGSPAVHYCCIWNGKKKVHSHNSGDHELEKLADLFLENAPHFHLWCFRSVKGRTYGFFVEEEITYFAIANSSIRNQSILLFLQQVRDGYKKSLQTGFMELVPTIQRLIAALENLPWQNADHISEVSLSSEAMPSTKVLLGKSSGRLDQRMGISTVERMEDEDSRSTRDFDVDASPEVVGGFSLQRSPSSNCQSRNQFLGRRLWLRQVKIIVAIDMLACMALFAIWLAICNGFNCVQ